MPSRIPDSPTEKSGKNSTSSASQLIPSAELIELLPDAILVVDQAGNIVRANSRTYEVFGYEPGELIGQPVEILVPQGRRTGHEALRQDFARHPAVRPMGSDRELLGRRRDGSEFPVEISLSPVQTEQGLFVLSAVRDVNHRKLIEAELRNAHQELSAKANRELSESRSWLAAIVDSSEDAIVGKNLDGIITSWNTGAETMYGYTSEEIMGKSISILTLPSRPDEIPAIMEKIRRGDRLEHYETVRVTKDGRHLQVSVSISPIRDSTGAVIGASAIARDITRQKHAEDQLRQAQKMEAVGRLAGGIAHDFNNVLGIITACTELMRGRNSDPNETSELLENISAAAHRGANLTRQLLGFSRKRPTQPVVFDLNQRLREVSKLVQPLMGDDVQVLIHDQSGPAAVEADPGQFDQIVMNLAVNARDAMPLGGKFILEIGSVQFDDEFVRQHPQVKTGRYVQLTVSDTGVGMDEGTVSHIFEPFFTTKDIGKGTGIGLATVYSIVRQANGYIWVYSEPSRGTTFKLYLPSANSKVGIDIPLESQDVIPPSKGETILLVEDDPSMRELTRKMLERHDYVVIEAEDGQAALAIVQSDPRKIDLVLTDVVMRGVNGPELGARLRTSRPEMRILYMSGYSGQLLEKHGAQTFNLLEKPFSRKKLLQAVHTVLE